MQRTPRRATRAVALSAGAGVALALVPGAGALAAPAQKGCENRTNTTIAALLECVRAEGAMEHLKAFQEIADENGGNRAAGLPGYDASVDYVVDVLEAVKDATGGAGADVVVEHVGEATWQTSLQAVRQHGRIAVCGATSGPNPKAALHRIWWKQLTIYGSTMGTKEDFDGAYELVASGRARPVIDTVLPLEEARAGHERMEAAEQFGKIVFSVT